MKLTIGIAFGMAIVLAYWILSSAVQRLDGQEVLTLPIEKHTDRLQDGFWKAIVASPTNELWMLMMQKRDRGEAYRTEFAVQIISRIENVYSNVPITGRIIKLSNPRVESNVIARIVWKGRTNECVLERNP